MNSSLIRHLGVALLGHYNLKQYSYPETMAIVFRKYRDDEKLLPNLLQNKKLQRYLAEFELEIPPTSVGSATLVAFALMFGEIHFDQRITHLLEPRSEDALFNKLKTRLKIRRL